MKNRVKLSLEELEAVNGSGFLDSLANVIENIVDKISDIPDEVIDLLDKIF